MLPNATQRPDRLGIVHDYQSDTLTIPRCGRLECTLHDIGQEIRIDLLGAILAYAVAALCQLIEVRHIKYVSKDRARRYPLQSPDSLDPLLIQIVT